MSEGQLGALRHALRECVEAMDHVEIDESNEGLALGVTRDEFRARAARARKLVASGGEREGPQALRSALTKNAEPLTDSDLSSIRARLAAVPRGEWSFHDHPLSGWTLVYYGYKINGHMKPGEKPVQHFVLHDEHAREFVRTSRETVEALIGEVERLRKVVEESR